MSDNAERPAENSGGADSKGVFDVQDVDALLADVEALASKVEQEVGLPENEADPVAVAEQIASDVAAIERSVAESVAEAASVVDGELAMRTRTSAIPSPASVGGSRNLVTEEDIAVADSEIFAENAASSNASNVLPADSSGAAPAVTARTRRIGNVIAIVVRCLDRGLAIVDRPFAGWSVERKALVGYVALATMVMALVAWVLGFVVR